MIATDTDLVIVTADKIADTGKVTWEFMFSLPGPLQTEVLDMPWGYVWQPRLDEQAFAINVFKSGEGLQVGAGWTDDDDPEWTARILADIPGCVLLMRTAAFEWLRDNVLDPNGRKYIRHHVDRIMATSR